MLERLFWKIFKIVCVRCNEAEWKQGHRQRKKGQCWINMISLFIVIKESQQQTMQDALCTGGNKGQHLRAIWSSMNFLLSSNTYTSALYLLRLRTRHHTKPWGSKEEMSVPRWRGEKLSWCDYVQWLRGKVGRHWESSNWTAWPGDGSHIQGKSHLTRHLKQYKKPQSRQWN